MGSAVNRQAACMLIGLLLGGSVLGTSSGFKSTTTQVVDTRQYTYTLSFDMQRTYPSDYLAQAAHTDWRMHGSTL